MTPIANKKVARAARTGGGSTRTGNRPMGFYTVIALIMILGTTLVVFSRHERLSATSPGSAHPYAPWTNSSGQQMPGDQWTQAYGVYLCDKFADNIAPKVDQFGVTTNNDGIIAIAPKEKKYAGRNTTFGLFAKSVDIKIARDAVQMPGGEEFKNGKKCGDKTGKLMVREWTNAKDDKTAKEIKANPKDILLKDNAAITIAYVPEDTKVTDIPKPPSANQLGLPNIGQPTVSTPALPANPAAPPTPGAP